MAQWNVTVLIALVWDVQVELKESTTTSYRHCLQQGSSTRGPRAACRPRASFVLPGKGISQNTMPEA